jgi:hypothetical protein
MQRCLKRGAYADVLSRFWRLGEGILYYRMKNEYGINPRDIWNKGNKRVKMDKLTTIRARNKAYRKEVLNFEGARKAMIAFQDKKYETLIKEHSWDKKVSDLTQARNGTIVAHGMLPVSRENAEKCLPVSEQILKKFLPDGDSLDRYPFRPEKIQEIASVLYPIS